MAKTPTRPPNRSRSERRKPRGHRMPSRDTSLRSQLAAAAARLREVESPDLAEAVEQVLTPTGWGRLRRSDPSTGGDTLPPNLPVLMPKSVREEIKANVAKAAAKNPAARITVASEAEKALEAFLAGEFVPVKATRAAPGTGEEKVNLNVRVDKELRQRAEDFGADHAADFGWAPRASHIIAGWLTSRFTKAGK